jgi:CubicO group peptidase (beta-lactamase class C family)
MGHLIGATLLALGTLTVESSLARPAWAQGSSGPALEDTVSLGSFLDGIMAAHREQFQIPSAVAVVVKGDRVLFARGYGKADLEAGIAVDPATSMFHIGSTGKLFTWTAVMQLVEQGKLDLDTDVNRYLKTFQIPATFPQPITLRHLMTHTAGFQEGVLGYFIGNDSIHIRSIEQTLREHIPVRVRPPGQLPSYSNYGASLAGLIVEQISGEPFAQYIERHIYQPLGIRYATFREPLPAALRPHAVLGYAREQGVFVPKPFEIDGGFVPAGGTVASGLDMARFMIAHLQNGRYGDAQILRPETTELMHRRAFGQDPRLPGMGLGFIHDSINGQHVIGHDGDSEYFHVELFLIPVQDVGVFVGYGGDGGIPAREGLKRAFFDRYFPATPRPSTPVSHGGPSLTKYTGHYRLLRMNYTDLDKLIYLFAPTRIDVSALANGRLLLSGAIQPHWPAQFAPVGPHLFQEVDGSELIAFHEDSSGRVSRLIFEPTAGTERVPWSEQTGFWYPVLAGAGVIFFSVLFGWYYRRREMAAMAAGERRALRLSTFTAGWLFATVAVAVVVVLAYGLSLLEHIPLPFKLMLGMPVVFVALALALAFTAVQVWRHRYWTLGGRLHYTLVALAALAVSWFFVQWNVLGWQFG